MNPPAYSVLCAAAASGKDRHLVWVGVEEFTADALLGSAPPPSLYVWIYGKYPDLKADLIKIIQQSGEPVLGEFVTSQQSQYVVQRSLRKCLPEEIDQLEETVFASLSEFFRFYGELFEDFDIAVQKQLRDDKPSS